MPTDLLAQAGVAPSQPRDLLAGTTAQPRDLLAEAGAAPKPVAPELLNLPITDPSIAPDPLQQMVMALPEQNYNPNPIQFQNSPAAGLGMSPQYGLVGNMISNIGDNAANAPGAVMGSAQNMIAGLTRQIAAPSASMAYGQMASNPYAPPVVANAQQIQNAGNQLANATQAQARQTLAANPQDNPGVRFVTRNAPMIAGNVAAGTLAGPVGVGALNAGVMGGDLNAQVYQIMKSKGATDEQATAAANRAGLMGEGVGALMALPLHQVMAKMGLSALLEKGATAPALAKAGESLGEDEVKQYATRQALKQVGEATAISTGIGAGSSAADEAIKSSQTGEKFDWGSVKQSAIENGIIGMFSGVTSGVMQQYATGNDVARAHLESQFVQSRFPDLQLSPEATEAAAKSMRVYNSVMNEGMSWDDAVQKHGLTVDDIALVEKMQQAQNAVQQGTAQTTKEATVESPAQDESQQTSTIQKGGTSNEEQEIGQGRQEVLTQPEQAGEASTDSGAAPVAPAPTEEPAETPNGIHPDSVAKLDEAMANLDAQRLGEYLHPDNKNLRQLFTDRTGVKLPKAVGGTKATILKWVGEQKTKQQGASDVDSGTGSSGSSDVQGDLQPVGATEAGLVGKETAPVLGAGEAGVGGGTQEGGSVPGSAGGSAGVGAADQGRPDTRGNEPAAGGGEGNNNDVLPGAGGTLKHEGYGTIEKPNRDALGEHFATQLSSGQSYPTINHARNEAGLLLGGKVSPGTLAAKHVDEAVEIGVTKAARKIVQSHREQGKQPIETFDSLVDLYNRQPSLNVRTSTSVAQQAYSTPAPLAFAASHLAGIGPSVSVYEPTAGNGMLLIGADPSRTYANELNPERAAALKSQGFDVTTDDATKHMPDETVDAVIMNPPFGAVKNDKGERVGWNVDGVKTNEVDQAIALTALHAMNANKPGARAVMILGAKGSDAKTDLDKRKAYLGKNLPFFRSLYDNYNVIGHYTANGDLYSRQGAGFPVDLIIVDGKGKAQRQYPWQKSPEPLNTWKDVRDVIDNKQLAVQRNPASVEPSKPELSGNGGGTQPEGSEPGVAGVPASPGRPGAVAGGADGGQSGGGATDLRPGTRSGGDQLHGNEPAGDAGAPTDSDGSGTGATETTPAGTPWGVSDEDNSQPEGGGRDQGTRSTELAAPAPPKREPELAAPTSGDAETQHQVSYQPASKSRGIGTLVPKNMQTAVSDALDGVRERHGDVDHFVADELGYPADDLGAYFSAEQVDALALAIDNHQRGNALIVGDQTGVGKGRIVAGVIRYARRKGLLPVFVTEKPNLYGDLIRDLIDTGQSTTDAPFEPLVTNQLSGDDVVPLPDGRTLTSGSGQQRVVQAAVENWLNGGELSSTDRGKQKTFHAIFTTYSQLQPVTPSGGKQSVATWRNELMMKVAPRAYFILDESHNAGGTQTKTRSGYSEDSGGRAGFVRQMIANAPGVLYSSATYAKRPEVMSLYSRTDMAKAVDSPEKLPDAIKEGGVPLQQVVAANLAEGGQYIRRERTFQGVTFEPKMVDIGLHRADKVAAVFRAINDFDKAKQEALDGVRDELTGAGSTTGSDTSTGKGGVESTNFASLLWNLVDQMLLTLKVDKAAEEAAAAVKRGEQVVIAVDNTMEAMLDRYIEETGIKPGDQVNLDFRAALHRYLQRSRQIVIRPPGEQSGYQHTLTDKELGPAGVAAYKAAEKLIEESGIDLPASPLDVLHQKLRQAGLSTGEITGRQNLMNYADDGSATLAKRGKEDAGVAGRVRAVKDFNSGRKQVLIINQSGSTGLSLHAHPSFPNHNKRHMIILQAAKNIDTFMQMLGRIHRTGQVVAPSYKLLLSNAPAEIRPAAVLVKKMGSLNASVTADRSGAVSFDVPDIINQVGDSVVAEYIGDTPELEEKLQDAKGDLISHNREGEIVQEGVAAKVSGRVALLPVVEQQAFWDDIIERYNDRIKELDALGENPLVAHRLELDAKTLETLPLYAGKPDDPSPFARSAQLEKMDVKMQGKPYKPEEVEAALRKFYGVERDEDVSAAKAKWRKEQSAALLKQTREYANESLAQMKDEVARARRKDAITSEYGKIDAAMTRYAPGTPVDIQTPKGDSLSGVVLGMERKGNAKNPAASGAWKLKIAVADAVRTLTMPISRVTGKTGGYTVTPLTNLPEMLKDFSRRQSVSREERYIATGNLLAAYAQAKDGTIITFTDDQGRTRQGILMPRSFSPREFIDKAPIPFPNLKQASSFLDKGYSLHTPDEGLKVYRLKDALVLETAKSKAKGGKYFLNKPLLAAGKPEEFVSAGSKSRMVVDDPAAQKRVLKSVHEQFGLNAIEAKEDAREHLGLPSLDEQIKGKKPGEDNGPTGRPRRGGYVNTKAIFDAIDALWEKIKQAAGLLKELPGTIHDAYLSLLGHSAPKITDINRRAGEAVVEYASSRITAPLQARNLASMVLDHHFGDEDFAERLGAVLTEDNLRSIRDGFEKAGQQEEADNVHSLIGAQDSPFATEEEYQEAFNDPEMQDAIQRHKDIVMPYAEELYRKASDIAPDAELPERGLETGARINLKALQKDEEMPAEKAVYVGGNQGNYTNPLKRKSKFNRQAMGNAEGYDINYENIVHNTIVSQLELANQRDMYTALEQAGLAREGKPGQRVELGGKPTIGIPIQRRTNVIVRPGQKPLPVPQNRTLYVRADVLPEVRRALDTDSASRLSILSTFADIANKTALASMTEAVAHSSNLAMALQNTPLLTDSRVINAINAFGGFPKLATAIVQLVRKWREVAADTPGVRDDLEHLAGIGALRGEGVKEGVLGRLLRRGDTATRLVMNDAFDRMVKAGLATDNATNRREFVNRVGQYNMRLQGQLVRLLRQTGLGPFATAGYAFNREAARMLTGSAGVKSPSKTAATKLRIIQLAGVIGSLAITPMVLNYVLTHKQPHGGVMGRPGTPFGAIDLGYNDKTGRPMILDTAKWLGVRRMLTATGVGDVIDMTRAGKTTAQKMDAVGYDLANSLFSPAMGPVMRTLSLAATGHSPRIGQHGHDAPQAAPGESQLAQNLKAAGTEFNPLASKVIHAATDTNGGAYDVASGQLPGLLPRAGRAPWRAEQTPAESLARDILDAQRPSEPPTDDQLRRSQAKREVETAIREKNPDAYKKLGAAVGHGDISGVQARDLARNSNLPKLVELIKPLDAHDAMRVYDVASDDEKREIYSMMMQKIGHSRTLSPPEKLEMRKRLGAYPAKKAG